VRVFFNSEDVVAPEDISALLSISDEEAELYLEYLVDTGELERYVENDIAVYMRAEA
jgi:Fic family protein